MILTVMGPPTHSDPHRVLAVWSLEELIVTYLHSRQWQRNERRREILDLLRLSTLSAGGDAARSLRRDLVDEANELGEPEYAVREPRQLSEAQRKIIFRGET